MKEPNFFIIGAPKCGTTALYEYLRRHRRVFLPESKEPNYFATDFPAARGYTTLPDNNRTDARYARDLAQKNTPDSSPGEAGRWVTRHKVARGHTEVRVRLRTSWRLPNGTARRLPLARATSLASTDRTH